MKKRLTTKNASSHAKMDTTTELFDNWFDPIESGLRNQVRSLIEAMIEGELNEVLSRPRYGRRDREVEGAAPVNGYRHGHRTRTLMGTFGTTEIAVPRARLEADNGRTVEWRSNSLRAYQRRTVAADALIASAYPERTRGVSGERSRPCSAARSARIRSAASGAR